MVKYKYKSDNWGVINEFLVHCTNTINNMLDIVQGTGIQKYKK